MNKWGDEFKRLQDSLTDAARIGKQELYRGVTGAKKQLTRLHFVQRRKELLAELGRNFYEAYQDGLPEDVKKFVEETEFKEIIEEITQLDAELKRRLEG